MGMAELVTVAAMVFVAVFAVGGAFRLGRRRAQAAATGALIACLVRLSARLSILHAIVDPHSDDENRHLQAEAGGVEGLARMIAKELSALAASEASARRIDLDIPSVMSAGAVVLALAGQYVERQRLGQSAGEAAAAINAELGRMLAMIERLLGGLRTL